MILLFDQVVYTEIRDFKFENYIELHTYTNTQVHITPNARALVQ